MSELAIFDAILEFSQEEMETIETTHRMNHNVISATEQKVVVPTAVAVASPDEVKVVESQPTAIVANGEQIGVGTPQMVKPHFEKVVAAPVRETIITDIPDTVAPVIPIPVQQKSIQNTIVTDAPKTIPQKVSPVVAIPVAEKVVLNPVAVAIDKEKFDFTQKTDVVAVLLSQMVQTIGYTANVQVITHKPTVCDMVFSDGKGHRLTTYVTQHGTNDPKVLVDLAGFKPGDKECSKTMDSILKYLTERGVVVKETRHVHNDPEGILRKKINAKAKGKASKEKSCSKTKGADIGGYFSSGSNSGKGKTKQKN